MESHFDGKLRGLYANIVQITDEHTQLMEGLKSYTGEQRTAIDGMRSENVANSESVYKEIKVWAGNFQANTEAVSCGSFASSRQVIRSKDRPEGSQYVEIPGRGHEG